MSRAFPSMTALLGLLAVAGYQNRDKLAGMLGGATSGASGGSGSAGRPGWLESIFGGSSAEEPSATGQPNRGAVVSGGLGELLDRFRQSGHSEAADSWVGAGSNRELQPHQLEQAIGPDVLEALQQQTGLSRDELIARLSKTLPDAVDKMTPQGRVPTHDETSNW